MVQHARYSYFGDPCLNCGGPHFWQKCPTFGVCGGLDGHWNSYPNSYSPSLNPYYDPPIAFDTYKINEEEENHFYMSNTEKMILEHTVVMREQLTEQGKALERMRAKLTQMMVEATTCNDLQDSLRKYPRGTLSGRKEAQTRDRPI
ncbi:hypothetical protein HAX54_021070 [Datura stramonium]|uniref:Uncharacterized protein n=1 Tax=Datura stramonium TaxID=4076 RepID=A0ABS8US22_DATST|nr:hypothetical protein [Datura stramonium]